VADGGSGDYDFVAELSDFRVADYVLLFHCENSRFVNSHKRPPSTANPHPLERHAFYARRPVGTQDVEGLVGTRCATTAMGKKPKPKAEVTMSHSLKSFADSSLKVVAIRPADNSDFDFEFPASGPQSTPSALTAPLEQPAELHRDPQAEIHTWHHGGLNE
jgi:hypothetical protein